MWSAYGQLDRWKPQVEVGGGEGNVLPIKEASFYSNRYENVKLDLPCSNLLANVYFGIRKISNFCKILKKIVF